MGSGQGKARRARQQLPSFSPNPNEYLWVGFSDERQESSDFYFDWERYANLTGTPGLEEREHNDSGGIPWRILTQQENSNGGCEHCGNTNIQHWSFFLHMPSNTVVKVGRVCSERLGLDPQAMSAGAKAREDEQHKKSAEDWATANPEEHTFLAERHQDVERGRLRGNEFYESLWQQLQGKGGLSEKQLQAISSSIQRQQERENEREAEQALHPDPAPSRCPEGRATILGRLLSVKWREDGFGGRFVITVLDDNGFKIWGTLGNELAERLEELCEENEVSGYQELLKKHRLHVGFGATLKPSAEDETFGFFKRPTGAMARVM